MQEIKIHEQTAGGRLDKAILKYLDKAPSSFVYKMLRKKNIVLNDKKASGNEILKEGDRICLYLADETIAKFRQEQKKGALPDGHDHPAYDIRSMILFEDEQVIALNKPAGMLSQRTGSKDLSLNDLLTRYLERTDLFTPGISNRLDRNTSGIILAGKNPAAVRELNRAILSRDVKKLYDCITAGNMPEDSSVEGFLIKDHDHNKVRILPSQTEGAFYIRTDYHVVSRSGHCSLLKVDLITGRSHQIRAHLASEGYPIIGDRKYGDSYINRYYEKTYGLRDQLLHAGTVTFHGMGQILSYLNGVTIKAPLPGVFKKIMKGEQLCLPGDPED